MYSPARGINQKPPLYHVSGNIHSVPSALLSRPILLFYLVSIITFQLKITRPKVSEPQFEWTKALIMCYICCLGHVKDRSWELYPGLPYDCRAPSAFPGTVVWSWNRSGTSGVQTNTLIWGIVVTSDSVTRSATVPVPTNKYNFKVWVNFDVRISLKAHA